MIPSGGRQRGLLRLKSRWRMVQARSSKGTRRVWAGALIAAFATIIVVGKALPFVVDTTEYAIVTDFGKPTQVITSPGLGFRRAYESIRTLDRRLFVYASPAAEFLTLGENPSRCGWDRLVARGRAAEVLRDRVRPDRRRIQARRHSVRGTGRRDRAQSADRVRLDRSARPTGPMRSLPR